MWRKFKRKVWKFWKKNKKVQKIWHFSKFSTLFKKILHTSQSSSTTKFFCLFTSLPQFFFFHSLFIEKEIKNVKMLKHHHIYHWKNFLVPQKSFRGEKIFYVMTQFSLERMLLLVPKVFWGTEGYFEWICTEDDETKNIFVAWWKI